MRSGIPTINALAPVRAGDAMAVVSGATTRSLARRLPAAAPPIQVSRAVPPYPRARPLKSQRSGLHPESLPGPLLGRQDENPSAVPEDKVFFRVSRDGHWAQVGKAARSETVRGSDYPRWHRNPPDFRLQQGSRWSSGYRNRAFRLLGPRWMPPVHALLVRRPSVWRPPGSGRRVIPCPLTQRFRLGPQGCLLPADVQHLGVWGHSSCHGVFVKAA